MQRAHFKERKAVALAALFLRLRGGKMKHLKLVKLMYLADREAMARWNHSITGDSYVSMNFGPVLSTVLDLIHEQGLFNASEWSQHISECAPHTVRLVKDMELDALSEAEEQLGREIFQKYGSMTRWALVDITHGFKEYKPTDAENRRWPIHYQEILQAVGKSPSEAASICKDLKETSKVRQMLAL